MEYKGKELTPSLFSFQGCLIHDLSSEDGHRNFSLKDVIFRNGHQVFRKNGEVRKFSRFY